MKKKIFIVLCIICAAMLGIGTTVLQQERQWQRGERPPQPVDTAAMRARQDSIQMFLDKLGKAIEGKEESPAPEVFQNVKLFQKATAGRLLGQMRSWTRALGVNCNYCHTVDQWEKDDLKPKLAAREMDKLEDDVNALLKNVKNIDDDAHINCFSCHHGSVKPEGGGFRGGPGGPGRPRRDGK